MRKPIELASALRLFAERHADFRRVTAFTIPRPALPSKQQGGRDDAGAVRHVTLDQAIRRGGGSRSNNDSRGQDAFPRRGQTHAKTQAKTQQDARAAARPPRSRLLSG